MLSWNKHLSFIVSNNTTAILVFVDLTLNEFYEQKVIGQSQFPLSHYRGGGTQN